VRVSDQRHVLLVALSRSKEETVSDIEPRELILRQRNRPVQLLKVNWITKLKVHSALRFLRLLLSLIRTD